MPGLDYINDFFYGTAGDLNMSRMVEFLEENPDLSAGLKNTWYSTETVTPLTDYFKPDGMMNTEGLEMPPLSQYKKMDLD